MHSTADIAKRLGCTVQAVNKYRRKVEKRDGKQLGTPDPTDGRRILFSDAEVALIKAVAPAIPVSIPTDEEMIEAELIDGEDEEQAIGPQSTSLALRHAQLPAVQRHYFDQAASIQVLAEIDTHTNATAARADSLLSEFAMSEMLAAAADIRQTVATLKANALGDAVAQLGKPVTGGADS